MGQEVEVIFVDEGGHVLISIACDELVGEVFDRHGGDPFTSVDGAVPENGVVLILAILAPNVDALLLATLERLTSNKDLGILGESTRKIIHILEMVVVRMVAIIPGEIRQIFGLFLSLVFARLSFIGNVLAQVAVHLLELRTQTLQLLGLVGREGEVDVLGNIVAPLLVVESREHLLDVFQLVAGIHTEDFIALILGSSGMEVRSSGRCRDEQGAQ